MYKVTVKFRDSGVRVVHFVHATSARFAVRAVELQYTKKAWQFASAWARKC